MFNRKKIEYTKEYLEGRINDQEERICGLKQDLRLLMDHLGLEVRQTPPFRKIINKKSES